MKIFVTGNQQFGRPNAIKKYKRPFNTVDEMNLALVDAWNSVVSDNDIVYVLGNFAWDPETAEIALKELNGTIVAIGGEYDKSISELVTISSISNDITYFDNSIDVQHDAKMVFSYWPLSEWQGKSKGYYSVIGYPDKKYKTNHKNKVINSSYDFWEYKPINVSEVVSLFNEVSS